MQFSPLRSRPIFLIIRMITYRIGLHSVLLPLLMTMINKPCLSGAGDKHSAAAGASCGKCLEFCCSLVSGAGRIRSLNKAQKHGINYRRDE